MRHHRSRILVTAALLSGVLLPARPAHSQTFASVVPGDPNPSCVEAPAAFAGWFQTGSVALNGFVMPPDSTVDLLPNCGFYRWSEQMFLWATSPAPTFYGGGSGTRVFESPVFYGVTAPDAMGARALVPHPSSVADVWFPAQADNEVLRAQGGSLVYYSRVINNVFAYFRGLSTVPGSFPTTAADRDAVIALATAHGVTLTDPDALAVELKMSWVEASTLADSSTYITTHGTVPIYDTSNPMNWVQIGTHRVLLAMTGMHVVGSTLNHPEMVWATFEHVANAPAQTYKYVNLAGSVVTVSPTLPTSPGWLFAAPGSAGPFNVQLMSFDPPSLEIDGFSGHTIGVSDTIQMKPWGLSSDASPAFGNTEVISMNVSVHGQMDTLAHGDLRNNYYMRGSTWYIPGSLTQVGTNQLTNTTMETYLQGTTTTSAGGTVSCLSCHVGTSTSVSHIFGALPGVVPPPPALPGSLFGGFDMLELHAFGEATALEDGLVLVSGGSSESTGVTASSELFDPVKNIWHLTGSLNTPRAQHTATSLGNGDTLAVGGKGPNGAVASAEIFDAVQGAWIPVAPLAKARSGHTATLLDDGRVIIVGGDDQQKPLASVELFNTQQEVWTQAAPLAKARSGHTATLLGDGRVIVVGGRSQQNILASAEIFDPKTNTWTAAGTLKTARAQHTATLLEDGELLITSGIGKDDVLASAELYHPKKNTWTSVGKLADARSLATATLLGNGQVLVTGGWDNGALSSAELYNPTTKDWFAASPLTTPRYGHTATLLQDGEVLLAGGMGIQDALSSTELFSEAPDMQVCNAANGCESCSDGLQNQGELGVDCGGPCMPCPCECTGAVTPNGGPIGPVACGDAVCVDDVKFMCADVEQWVDIGPCQ